MRTPLLAAGALLLSSLALTGVQAADYAGPAHHYRYHGRRHASIGDCVRTRVDVIGTAPGSSEPVIRYRDGVIQAFDSGMLGQTETKPGDPIQLCLVSFVRDCGEDDLPGRTYAVGNLRTGAAWTSPDVRSSCAVRQ